MKYLNLKKQIALLAIVAIAFTACKKVESADPMGDAGQTLVKIIGGATPSAIVKAPIDFVATPKELAPISLRRDVPNSTELNKAMVITVKDDTAAVTAANPAYKQLPTAWYTLKNEGGTKTGGQGGTFTFNLPAGVFAREIYVTIPNATLLDPSSLYGLGFTITSADAGGIISQKSVVLEIGAKNAYDGIYSIEAGSKVTRYTSPGNVDVSNPALNGTLVGNDDIILSTIGATKVSIPPSSPAVAGRLLWAFGANSAVSGIDGIQITVNPSTGAVNSISTGFATSNATFGNWAGHDNDYNAGTKTFRLAWMWTTTAPAYREYEMVLKYKGPR